MTIRGELSGAGQERQRCEVCDEGVATRSMQTEIFNYGTGSDEVQLQAVIPVWHCDSCGTSYADPEAELLRHEAVCEHLGRLSPRQVRAVREAYGLTQDDWAEFTGLGLASVKRWETGSLIQGAANDLLLRLLSDGEVYAKVQKLHAKQNVVSLHPFRTEIKEETREAAKQFHLRSEIAPKLRVA